MTPTPRIYLASKSPRRRDLLRQIGVNFDVLTFRADLDPTLRGVSIDVRCNAIDRARREGNIADRDLSSQPSTTQLQFVLLPPNRPPPPPPPTGG